VAILHSDSPKTAPRSYRRSGRAFGRFFRKIFVEKRNIIRFEYEEPLASLLGSHKGQIVEERGIEPLGGAGKRAPRCDECRCRIEHMFVSLCYATVPPVWPRVRSLQWASALPSLSLEELVRVRPTEAGEVQRVRPMLAAWGGVQRSLEGRPDKA
jgi:hypothetical protein